MMNNIVNKDILHQLSKQIISLLGVLVLLDWLNVFVLDYYLDPMSMALTALLIFFMDLVLLGQDRVNKISYILASVLILSFFLDHFYSIIYGYLIFSLIILLFILKNFHFGDESQQLLRDKHLKIMFILVFVVGFVLRFWKLGYLDFTIDETLQVLASSGIMENFVPLMPYKDQLYYRAAVNSYLISFSRIIFGNTEFAARLPSALIGTLLIPVSYLSSKRYFNRRAGLLASIVIAFSAWIVYFSKLARMYIFASMAFILLFYLSKDLSDYLIEGDKSKRRHSLAFLIVTILGLLSHRLVILALISTGSYILAKNFLTNGMKEYDILIKLLAIFGGLFSIFIVLTPFKLSAFIKIPKPGFLESVWAIFYPENILFYLTWYFDQFPLVLLFSFLGVLFYLRNKLNFGLKLLCWIVLPFSALMLLGYLRAPRYTLLIFPVMIVVASGFFERVISRQFAENEVFNYVITFCVIIIFVLSSIGGFSVNSVVNPSYCDQDESFMYLAHLRWSQYNEAISGHIDSRDKVMTHFQSRYRYYFNREEDFKIKNVSQTKEVISEREDSDVWLFILSDSVGSEVVNYLHSNNEVGMVDANYCGRLWVFTTDEESISKVNERLKSEIES